MKFFVAAVVLVVCAAAQAATFGKSPAITLLDYYKTNKDVGRIISGQPAKQGQFPWQVALSVSHPGGIGLCGGSLISPRWVLTAAHCVDGIKLWGAKIGSIHRNAADEPGSVFVSSRTGIKHEDYNANMNNDIGLVKLDQDVPLSDTIQTIRLPARSEVGNALDGIKATVSGWGNTSIWSGNTEDLNFVELDTISNAKCAEYYGTQAIISSTICCVGRPEHSTCNGDSGGPLIRIAEDGKPTQIGVVSFVSNAGSAGCASGAPSAYVRTASFLDWINEHTGIAVRP